MLQGFLHRLNDSCLVIRDAMFLTERFSNFLRFLEIIARHVGEQVMLNLIVETPIAEIMQDLSH